jgi:hypothetical protein
MVDPVTSGPSSPVGVASDVEGYWNPPELGPLSVPVQLAPLGQHATWSASSLVHLASVRQQTPVSSHGSYPPGQLPSRLKSSKMSYALPVCAGLAVMGCANGMVSIDRTLEARNVAAIHPEAFISC